MVVKDEDEELKYTHSIICHEDDARDIFDLQELVKSLQEGSMES